MRVPRKRLKKRLRRTQAKTQPLKRTHQQPSERKKRLQAPRRTEGEHTRQRKNGNACTGERGAARRWAGGKGGKEGASAREDGWECKPSIRRAPRRSGRSPPGLKSPPPPHKYITKPRKSKKSPNLFAVFWALLDPVMGTIRPRRSSRKGCPERAPRYHGKGFPERVAGKRLQDTTERVPGKGFPEGVLRKLPRTKYISKNGKWET